MSIAGWHGSPWGLSMGSPWYESGSSLLGPRYLCQVHCMHLMVTFGSRQEEYQGLIDDCGCLPVAATPLNVFVIFTACIYHPALSTDSIRPLVHDVLEGLAVDLDRLAGNKHKDHARPLVGTVVPGVHAVSRQRHARSLCSPPLTFHAEHTRRQGRCSSRGRRRARARARPRP